MNWRKMVIPGTLLAIGIFNSLIAILFPSYGTHGMLFAFSAIFIILALVTYTCGQEQTVQEGTIAELLPHVVFDLPHDTRFTDLTLKRTGTRTELSGVYRVAGEEIRVKITHLRREDLTSDYKTTENPGENLLEDIREKDENTPHIQNFNEYTKLQVNGEPITAYTAEVKGMEEDRPVLRGMANLGETGLLLISVAAHSWEGLEKTTSYLATMQV